MQTLMKDKIRIHLRDTSNMGQTNYHTSNDVFYALYILYELQFE